MNDAAPAAPVPTVKAERPAVFTLIDQYYKITDPQLRAEFYHDNPDLYTVFSALNHPSKEETAKRKEVRLAAQPAQ